MSYIGYGGEPNLQSWRWILFSTPVRAKSHRRYCNNRRCRSQELSLPGSRQSHVDSAEILGEDARVVIVARAPAMAFGLDPELVPRVGVERVRGGAGEVGQVLGALAFAARQGLMSASRPRGCPRPSPR